MTGTISSAGKCRTKVQIPERPGFNQFTKPGPGFSSRIPIFSKYRRTGAEGHKAATVKNSAKQNIPSRIPIPSKRSSHPIETVPKIVKGHGNNNEYLSGSGTEARKVFTAPTISSAAKSREKARVTNIDGKKWDLSTRPNNPDGPIKPLPSIENYRKSIVAQCKKHAKLLITIEANKQEAVRLIDNGWLPRKNSVEQLEHIDGFGYICKDNNIYSSLPPMGGEEDYLKLFTIDEDVKFGQGGCCVVFQGWRLSDNKEVAMKKINKSEVDTWG